MHAQNYKSDRKGDNLPPVSLVHRSMHSAQSAVAYASCPQSEIEMTLDVLPLLLPRDSIFLTRSWPLVT